MARGLDKAYERSQPSAPTIHSATDEDISALRRFVALAAPTSGDLLERHLRRPRRQPGFTRLARVGDEVIGAALIGHVRLRLGPATIEAGAIDLLAVQEAWREQGVFSLLIGDMLRQMIDAGLPLALVNGANDLRSYGFGPFRLASTVSGWRRGGATINPRRPDERDLEDLAALYEATYQHLPLREARTTPDWRWLLAGQPNLIVQEDSRGRVAAYALSEGPNVVEAAAADAGAARALLAVLAGDARLELPLEHPVARAAIQDGGIGMLAAELEGAGASGRQQKLAGIVDLPGMLEQLVPAFEERLAGSRYAGWSGNLRIEIETERVTLAFDGGRAEVIDGSRPADLRMRRVTLQGLGQCSLGYRSISDLRAAGELDCDDSALSLLDTLFPVV